MTKLIATTAFALCLSAGFASAQGVPTIDITSIVQLKQMVTEAKLQLTQAIEQNLKLDQQTIQLIEQIKLMESQYNALVDDFDQAKLLLEGDWLEDLIPDIPDLSGSVEAAIRGEWKAIGTDGYIGGTKTIEIVDEIFASAGVTTEQMTELANSEDPETARVGVQANTGAMMGVAAEASQEAATQSLERITELTSNISDTDGMKAAIDLNTRMTAELAMSMANIWQLEAAQTIGLGQAGVMSAATLADEQKYLDLSLSPDE